MIAGRYALNSEIGRGGMGIVWRGHDEVLEREVALKRIGLAPGGTSPDLQRAEREARLAATLHHPNVVSVFDLAVDGDEHWLVMEYVDSRNLAQLVRDNGPLPVDAAARLLAQVADALAAAHEVGIVHRDVKPSNILVTQSGQAKITDFGIARAKADATLTQTGMVTGSPAYLAPEVAAGEQASPVSDVWSLGATLFHALTGHPPYDVGENVVGALYKIVHEEPPRVPDAGWLAPVLEATMATDKNARWSMAQVRDVLRGGPGGAAPPVPAATQRLESATRTVPVAAAPPAAAAASAAAPPRIAPEPPQTSRGPRHLGALLVAGLVLIGVLLVAWAIARDEDTTPSADPQGDETPAATRTPDESATEDEPSEEPAEEPSTPEESEEEAPSEEAMQAFVEDYYATAPSDPETTWQQLTRGFQRESGGYGAYSGYWGTIESATVGDVAADPEAMSVSFGVSYVRKDGSTASDSVTLQLEQAGDSFLVSGES